MSKTLCAGLALLALCAGVVGCSEASTPGSANGTAIRQVPLRAYVRDSASPQQIAALSARLKRLQSAGRVRSFQFSSKEQELQKLRKKLHDPSILDELPSNPLPAMFEIFAMNPGDAQPVTDEVLKDPAVDPVLGVD